jgi:hypothetical protein
MEGRVGSPVLPSERLPPRKSLLSAGSMHPAASLGFSNWTRAPRLAYKWEPHPERLHRVFDSNGAGALPARSGKESL